jgi:hypothetical protein
VLGLNIQSLRLVDRMLCSFLVCSHGLQVADVTFYLLFSLPLLQQSHGDLSVFSLVLRALEILLLNHASLFFFVDSECICKVKHNL